MEGITSAGGMGGLANALESQRSATEVVTRPLDQGQNGFAATEMRSAGPEKPAAPLATGQAVAGVGENIDITV
jgi:hypothetical protein